MKKRITLLAAAAALTLVGGQLAADPGETIFEGWVEGTGEPIEAVFGLVDESPCGFPVYVDYRYYEVAKLFYDENGVPTELRFWDRKGRFAYYTDDELGGNRLEEKNSVLVARFLFDEGLIIVRGNGQHLTLPKLGNVFRHTGYWLIDLAKGELTIQHGNQGTWPDGDWSAFCDAILPPTP